MLYDTTGHTQNQTYFPVLRNVYDDQKYTTLYLVGVIVHLLKLIGADTFKDNAQQVLIFLFQSGDE